MPIIDALDFLIDKKPSLRRSVIYLHYGSGGLRSRVIAKIKKCQVDAGAVVSETTMPLSGSLVSLIKDVCDYLDLSLLSKTRENWNLVSDVLAMIPQRNLPSSGLILALPITQWSLEQGPVWFGHPWAHWQAVEGFADVVVEPIVSECSSEILTSKLMVLSDLFSFDRIKNKDDFYGEMKQFSRSGSMDLRKFCDRFDYITLVGVDYETGWFDRDAVAMHKPNTISRTTIGSALTDYVLNPTSFSLKNAVHILGGRLNRQSVTARSATRQITSVSLTLLVNQPLNLLQMDYWAWLVLSRDTEHTAAGLMFSFFDLARSYQDFCCGQPADGQLALRLDPIVRSVTPTDQRPASTLGRARVDLITELTKRMHARHGTDQPLWTERLQVALRFASAGSRLGEDDGPPSGMVEQSDENANQDLSSEGARPISSRPGADARSYRLRDIDDDTEYDTVDEENGIIGDGKAGYRTLPEALSSSSIKWAEGDHLHSISDIIGQENVKTALRLRILSGDAYSHYVLQGPAGVGKRAIARIFARGINCESPLSDGSACETCESCVMSRRAGETFLDWHRVRLKFEREVYIDPSYPEKAVRTAFIERSVKRKELREIRNIVSLIGSRDLFHRRPVFIIDNAELLDKDASDMLLQALEKNSQGALCVFLTTDVSRLRAALKSRTHVYRLGPLTREQALDRVQAIGERQSIQIEDGALNMLAAYSEDRAGAIFNTLWKAGYTGEITVSHVRKIFNLSWVEHLLPFWRAMVDADEEGVLAELAGMHKNPVEALRLLQLSMYVLNLPKSLLTPEHDRLLPPSFMNTGTSNIVEVIDFMKDLAKNLHMMADDVMRRIGRRLSLIEDSEDASICAEILYLAKDLRTGFSNSEAVCREKRA